MAGRRSLGLGFVCAFGVMVGPAVGNALAAPQIYWGNFGNGTIGAAAGDGSGVNQNFMTGFGAQEPAALAVDGRHLFWANRNAGTIGVANLDGTVVNPSLITGIQGVNAIAVNDRHIYWANAVTDTIGEANLDGTGVKVNLIIGADAPIGLAVDGQHIYWTNISTNTVGEANLDGTGVNQSLITGANGITGLALDGDHLYWGNSGSQTIGEANLDGTHVNQSYVTGAGNVLGVAVYGDRLLWNDFIPAGSIGSAPLDGGTAQLGFITGADYPFALAVAVPVADVSPMSPPRFAGTAKGSLSSPATFTVTNTGQAPLLFTGTSFSLSGANPGDFTVGAGGCLAGVGPGASCQVKVYFTPHGVGARSAVLNIASNDYANGALQVPLSGTGTTASSTSTGNQHPAAKVDLVTCKTVTKTVYRKVHGKRRKVSVKQQKCSHKLVAESAATLKGPRGHATISRGHVTYAIGTGVELGGGRTRLVLTDLRPLRPGSYTLTLRKRSTTITLG